jgi:osmotically-inducible protein OsmY
MGIRKSLLSLLALAAFGLVAGCSSPATKSPDVSGSIKTSLNQSGLKDVSVSQDRDKGVVTLGGHVSADPAKSQAESIAKSLAGTQVVSNEIAVLPPGAEHDTKKMDSDLDKGIEVNLDAALIQGGLHKNVSYTVKNQVVTLTGGVDSQARRMQVQSIASTVPNVQQVVNELEVKAQKATSSN